MFQPNFLTFTNIEIEKREPIEGEVFAGNQHDGFEYATFADGSGGVIKHLKDWRGNKTGRLYRAEILSTQEYLAARVGEVMNAPIRDCLFIDAKTIIMPFVTGENGDRLGKEGFPDDAQGWNLRLFDFLVANADRRPKNVMFCPDGRIVGIDHALCNFRPRKLMAEQISDLWNHGLSLEALLILQPKLATLEPVFQQVGMSDKFETMLANLAWLTDAFQALDRHAVITKGDFEGHPFHGNQWTGGEGGGEKLAALRAIGVNLGDHVNPNSSAYVSKMNIDQQTAESAGRAVADALKDATPVVMVGPDALEGILKDGRIKSQFETGTSAGLLDAFTRWEVEKNLFGYPYDTRWAMRPIYGTVALHNPAGSSGDERSIKACQDYGDIRLVLKDSVKDRTTFTLGDSLTEEKGNATPALLGETNPLKCFAALSGTESPEWTAEQIKGSASQSPEDRVASMCRGTGYVETQIHGGVTTGDIAYIVVPKIADGVGLTDSVRLARKCGIEVRFTE